MANKKFYFNLDLVNNKALNVATPTARTDGAPKGYVDDSLSTAVTDLEGQISSLTSASQASLDTAIDDLNAAILAAKNEVRTEIQGILNGLPPRQACKVISTSAITLSGTQTIDGVSLMVGDRVLVAGQGGSTSSAHINNGIYVVSAGAWTRAADADSSEETIPGMFVPVNEGSSYGDTQWFLLTDGVITPGTTPQRYDRYGASDAVVAGDGLERDGNVLSVKSADTDQLSVSASGVGVVPSFIAYLLDLANSTGNLATNRITGLLAYIRGVKLNEFAAPDGDVSLSGNKITNLAAPVDSTDAATKGYIDAKVGNRFYSTLIGNNSATSFTVTHSLDSKQVIVQVYSDATGATVEADVVRTTANAVSVSFDGVTPANDEFRVLVALAG